ncbi:MAG: hypothetical protein VKK07_10435 [Merismopediaceae bacterium]|nr:hypothetical protein [Merismopediaceae bacterium]
MINTRLKLLLICNLNRQKINSHRGFALPMAMMVGMVILVVGATIIIRAQSDQSKMITQSTTNRAMAIAEAGATRYIEFLNNNRGLIPFPSCVTTDSTTGACTDGNTVKSLYQATNIPNIVASPSASSPSPSASPSCSTSNPSASLPSNYQTYTASDIKTTWANSAASGSGTGWRDIGNGAGQYRIVAYRTYTDTSASTLMNPSTDQPTAVRRGRLIVEGRVNQSGTGATATADAGRTGIARLEFTIPVTATTTGGASPSPSASTGFPGLWARDFSFTNNVDIHSDVWNSSGCVSGAQAVPAGNLDTVPTFSNGFPVLGSGVDGTPGANNGNKAIYATGTTIGVQTAVNQAFPDLPGGNTWAAPTTSNKNNVNCTSWSSQYPRTNDVDSTGKVYGSGNPPANNATYIYNCSGNMEGSGSTVTLGRTGQETFIFYVNGYFHINSNGNLVPYNGGANGFTRSAFYVKGNSGDFFQVNANGNVGDMRDPTAFQVYVYGSDAGTINTSGYQHSMELKGNGSFYGFLFAPFANVATNGTTDNAGAFWVKSIESVGNYKIWQGISGASRLMVTMPSTASVTTYQLDGSPNQWRRIEAN